MGMFDTFHIHHQSRELAVQSKQFANVLNHYLPGDFVARDETEARSAAEVIGKLWQSPERQAEALQHHARAHYQARITQQHALDRISRLLHDHVEWQEREAKGEADTRMFGFMRHDFSKETWDWAIARLLLELPEYRKRVPAGYAVGAEVEAANLGSEEKP